MIMFIYHSDIKAQNLEKWELWTSETLDRQITSVKWAVILPFHVMLYNLSGWENIMK